MITEEQKYDSSIFRNIGFAFLAPLGSIAFQKIVSNKSISGTSLIMGIIVCVLGLILLYSGRFVLKEKNKK
ncbi:MAG: hypothetical protein HY094_07555 [Candidatus Melainabacteria bacterium]|nr:hypothetical protein [Candidatus Melainabacteria bacterium]